MVNVQPTNRKLRKRAGRIIGEVTGVDIASAVVLLDEAEASIKAAIVMQRIGCTREQAESRLASCQGQVAMALNGETKAL
jgi:N-acetylmuramic acid 6-phosphate etherase